MHTDTITLYDAQGNRIERLGFDVRSAFEIAPHRRYIGVPRWIDMHLSPVNGRLSKQALEALGVQATQNGIVAMALWPLGESPIDTPQALESIKSYMQSLSTITFLPIVSATKADGTLSNIATLIDQGAVGVALYSDADSNILRRVMQYAKLKNVPLFCTLRDNMLNAQTAMHDGAISAQLGLVGNTPLAEVVQVAKIIEMTRHFGVTTVIRGISVVDTLHRIAKAKEEGVSVYAEVAIHHLIRDDRACLGYNTYAKIEPPLRDEMSMIAMQVALKMGKIDFLTAQHQPLSPQNKATAFAVASNGTANLENLFGLYYTTLVESGLVGMEQLMGLLVGNMATLLHRELPVIKSPDDMVLFAWEPMRLQDTTSLYCGTQLSLTQVARK
ncbi:MAG: hypothetical protein KU37_08380 [Sulfuricurvum sp. PC08-66]|nr:MAG: hypothetical protein KU37_08380 [Sulfuricurvum sp. PC08-66]